MHLIYDNEDTARIINKEWILTMLSNSDQRRPEKLKREETSFLTGIAEGRIISYDQLMYVFTEGNDTPEINQFTEDFVGKNCLKVGNKNTRPSLYLIKFDGTYAQLYKVHRQGVRLIITCLHWAEIGMSEDLTNQVHKS